MSIIHKTATYGGALSLLLHPNLAVKLHYYADAERPSNRLFEAVTTGKDVSPGERVQCAVVLAFWNGSVPSVDIGRLGILDDGARARLGRFLVATSSGRTWEEWAGDELHSNYIFGAGLEVSHG